ncbi:hypothetical protein THRCLA_20178 [Thraustotheca clavata]|uniref:Uncharacterized protein n=1 Tax=Thraustotheca clavata TaxID=74557 RepID=A0A1W0AAV4_9STRA|nr:hypothetical protein THRCLA_20178 [Thraustotheca clavata]
MDKVGISSHTTRVTNWWCFLKYWCCHRGCEDDCLYECLVSCFDATGSGSTIFSSEETLLCSSGGQLVFAGLGALLSIRGGRLLSTLGFFESNDDGTIVDDLDGAGGGGKRKVCKLSAHNLCSAAVSPLTRRVLDGETISIKLYENDITILCTQHHYRFNIDFGDIFQVNPTTHFFRLSIRQISV